MPSVSGKQARFMRGVASGSIKPRKGSPSKAVAREFVRADRGKRRRGASAQKQAEALEGMP